MEDNVVFFDGVCNLCNTSVSFLIKKDKKRVLKYSSLQGNFAKKVLRKDQIENMSSLVFLKQGILYTQSEAVIQILLTQKGWYLFLGQVLSKFPQFILDVFYTFIAKYRYKFFGVKDVCRLPKKEETSLFID